MAEPAWWIAPTASWAPDYQDPTTKVWDWDETFEQDQPGAGGTYARDDAAETLVGWIPWEKRYAARKALVGYAWADTSSPWKLHRVNPLQHPDEPQLRCVTADFAGYNIAARLIPDSDPPEYAAWDAPAVSGTFARRMKYAYARTTLKYRPHPYPFFSDTYMDTYSLAEYYRNCSIFDQTEPQLQVLAAQSEPFLKWADAPASPDTTPSQNSVIGLEGGELSILLSQSQLWLAWFHVPMDFIAAPYLPSKIMQCMGKLNDRTWLGVFPKGTLRMDAPRITRRVQSHIRTTGAIPFVCDVLFPFSFFDPVPAPVSNNSGVPKWRGWNLLPWARTGKFYSAVRTGDSNRGLYEYANYDAMFTHVGDTSVTP